MSEERSMMAKRRRIGIMGGTFDPIHIGHLILAECAYEQFDLEQVLFLPAGNPPHKQCRSDGASDVERLEMVRLAIQKNPHFALDTEEMQHGGQLTYTNVTLLRLKQREPDAEYFFIIGADSLMSFDTWKNPQLICQNCILVVAVRDGLDMEKIQSKMDELKRHYDATILLLHSPEIAVSSSSLRQRRREHRSIRYYVTSEVLDYIEQKDIYKD